jgi:hypothetical protein
MIIGYGLPSLISLNIWNGRIRHIWFKLKQNQYGCTHRDSDVCFVHSCCALYVVANDCIDIAINICVEEAARVT